MSQKAARADLATDPLSVGYCFLFRVPLPRAQPSPVLLSLRSLASGFEISSPYLPFKAQKAHSAAIGLGFFCNLTGAKLPAAMTTIAVNS